LDVTKALELKYLDCRNNYMATPEDVIGWEDLGLTINSPHNLQSGTFWYYNQSTGLTFTEAFPDPGFRAAVLEMPEWGGSKGADDIISGDERAVIALRGSLDVSNREIKDLSGIEFFYFLPELNVANNQLTELNLTKNLHLAIVDCSGNQLTELDLSNKYNLRSLDCSYNKITELDVSQIATLEALWCNNNQLRGLDVTQNTALLEIYCSGNRMVSPDDVVGWQDLDLAINSPDALESGSFRFYNQIEQSTGLTFAEAFPDPGFLAAVLEMPDWGGNREADDVISAADMDVIANRDIVDISFRDIKDISGIEYFMRATHLYAEGNQLTELDLSDNAYLVVINCYDNQLTKLNVSQNTALVSLDCNDNQLAVLNVSHNTALKELWCEYNLLTELNVSNNTALVTLYCYFNQLTELNVSQNAALAASTATTARIANVTASA
jgi:Leucine-rich repeat (LRR) protein